MSTYEFRERWGMGSGVDPHFDARVGRVAAESSAAATTQAHASGYIELEGTASQSPCDYLESLIEALYGGAPADAGLLYHLTGALGMHDRPLAWTQIRELRYLTTDPDCGVALPLHDSCPAAPWLPARRVRPPRQRRSRACTPSRKAACDRRG